MSDKADFAALAGRTQMYALQVKRLFDEAVNELLDISKQVKSIDDDDMFTFDMKKSMEDKAQAALRKLHSAVYTATKRGIVLEWGRADNAADEFVASTFGKQVLKDNRYSSMLLRHESAMNAFINRTENGMNLSDRVWKPVEQLRKEMELALTVSIGEGESASTIARRVKQYLNDPDKLFRRVRDEKGNLKLSKAAKEYHPGRGVYRSSYKNAMRLTRTETNMAYRNEDCNRVSDLDFVLGIRIQTSKNHPEDDICDELAGDYPKTFKWTGWHPQCRCYMTSILPTADELRKYNKALLNGESYTLTGQVKGYPAAFKQWVNDHSEKIENGGSVPYFVSDNQQAIDRILGKQPTIAELAAERHAARTPEQEQAIRDAWAERNHKRELIKNGANNVYNVAKDWNEVDASELQKAIESGDYMQMKAASKAVAQAIVEMRAKENALKDIIPDVHTLHGQFTIAELEGAYNAIKSKLDNIATLPIDQQPKQIEKEMLYVSDPNYLKPHTIHSTWEIAHNAYANKLAEVQETIAWSGIKNAYTEKAAFVTKSQPYKDLVQELADAIAKKDMQAANAAIVKIDDKRAQLDKSAAKRAMKGLKAVDFDELSEMEIQSLLDKYENNDVGDVDTVLRSETETVWSKLSKDERKQLTKYTQTFCYLNEPLRNLTYSCGASKQDYINDLPIMTRALAKVKAKDAMVVRRGTDNYNIPEIQKNLSEVEVGDVFIDGAFMSTAAHRSKGFFRSYNLVIIIPKGAQGIFAEPFSHFNYGNHTFTDESTIWNGKDKDGIGGEFEWIGQRGSKFKVVKKDGRNIYLELIGQLYDQP